MLAWLLFCFIKVVFGKQLADQNQTEGLEIHSFRKALAILTMAFAQVVMGQQAPQKSVAQLAKETWNSSPKLVFDGMKNGSYAFHYITDKGTVSIKAACSSELDWADGHSYSFNACPGLECSRVANSGFSSTHVAYGGHGAEFHDANPVGYFYKLGSAASLTIYFVVQNDKWRPNDVPPGCGGPGGICCAGIERSEMFFSIKESKWTDKGDKK